MPGSPRQMNWTDVVFTPTSGQPISITEVTDIQIDDRLTVIKGKADADFYPTSKSVVEGDPLVTVSTDNVRLIELFGGGFKGSLTFKLNDSINGEGAGALIYTLNPAIVTSRNRGNTHATFAKGVIAFETKSADGITPSLSVSPVTS